MGHERPQIREPDIHLQALADLIPQHQDELMHDWREQVRRLPAAQKLVQAHGGEVSVESQVERGSTFSFTLPDGRQGQREEN